ncbi:MAG: hypothetical protein KF869_07880 [Phycisphaeraceae bacterium]|nr:hypothetical protein [Phycisphaeraceae bacterium]
MDQPILEGTVQHRLERAKRLGDRGLRHVGLVEQVSLEPADVAAADAGELRLASPCLDRVCSGVPDALDGVEFDRAADGFAVELDVLGEGGFLGAIPLDLPTADGLLFLAACVLGFVPGDFADHADRF